MRPTLRIAVLGITIALGAATPAASQAVAGMRQLFNSDSLTVVSSQESPNGKWIVFAAESGAGQRLWIAPVGGGAPIPLTSDGYDDQSPRWLPTGDRVAFASTRANRNGGGKFYVMVLSIDPATGHAVGVPRQVSSEPVLRGGRGGGLVSPDGRWLAYWSAEEPTRIKLIPSNGGIARVVATLAPKTGPSLGTLVFSPDGKQLYFGYQTGPIGAVRFAILRVAVQGGVPETVATADHPIAVYKRDPRLLFHQLNVGNQPAHWELRSLNGEVMASVTLPRGMRFSGAYDGSGLLAVSRKSSSSVRVTSTGSGETRVLTTTGGNWPEAWMPDGSAILSDRPDGDSLALELLPLTGGARRSFPLPGGTTSSGWSSSVGPYFSYRSVYAQTGGIGVLHAIDVRTGSSRVVSRAASTIGVNGRGGFEQDGSRWVVVERVGEGAGGRIEVKSIDPATGESKLIRSFPDELRLAQGLGFSVHGERVVFMLERGDSVDLLLTSGTTGAPRRLASFPMGIESRAWSWGGDQIAVSYYPRVAPRRGILTVIDVPRTAAESPKLRNFELGADNGCDQLQWMPDDSSIFMLCYRPGGRIVKLRLSDGERAAVVSGDDPQQIWEYLLSPDGRQVVYPVDTSRGSSIYFVDFNALMQAMR